MQEMPMPSDPAHFLNELPIWKLKVVAAEYRIDISACKYKKDFISKIRSKKITEEQVRKALAKAKAETERPSEELKDIGKDLEMIARRPLEPSETPAHDEQLVERHIDEALTMRPAFFEVDSTSESAMNRMLIGDFNEAIKMNRDARLRCLDSFSTFQVYSAALSIRAVDELLARLPEGMPVADSTLKTAVTAAKRAFLNGPPRQREEALESLEALAAKTYEAFVKHSEGDEVELRSLLADYESFGTRTEESRRYLEIAASAKQTFNMEEYSRYVNQARDKAETAKQDRVKEIGGIFHLIAASAAEAKELGADTAVVESNINDARRAYEDGSFKRSVELLASVDRALDGHHVEMMRRRRELEAAQLQKAGGWVAECEPVLAEAASYGFDVKDAQAKLSIAKTALANRDAVNASKYGRYIKETVHRMDRELDNKRLEMGTIRHVDGAKCEECGQESVYEHPNSSKKCMACGYIAPKAVPVAVPADQSATGPQLGAEPKPSAGQIAQDAAVTAPGAKKRRLLRW